MYDKMKSNISQSGLYYTKYEEVVIGKITVQSKYNTRKASMFRVLIY